MRDVCTYYDFARDNNFPEGYLCNRPRPAVPNVEYCLYNRYESPASRNKQLADFA